MKLGVPLENSCMILVPKTPKVSVATDQLLSHHTGKASPCPSPPYSGHMYRLQFAYQPSMWWKHHLLSPGQITLACGKALTHYEDCFLIFSVFSCPLDKLEDTGLTTTSHPGSWTIWPTRLCVGHSCLQFGCPLRTVLSPFILTPYIVTSPITHLTAICKSSLTTPQSSVIREGTTEPTDNLSRVSWTGSSRPTSRTAWERPKHWWWTSAGPNTPAHS